jgi:alpha-amylase
MKHAYQFLTLLLALTLLACDVKPPATLGGTSPAGSTGAGPKPMVQWKTPDWAKNATIYEVNIRQYTPEGTFNAFARELPRLRQLGADILWLMPIYPIAEKNRKCNTDKEKTECHGSPYAASDFEAVNPRYGTLDDFKRLVRQAHELGMKVILDFVPDHTGWDSKWMREHPEYFVKVNGKFTTPLDPASGKPTDWDDVAMLDYKNPALRRAITDAHLFWVRETDVDGFREDVSGFVPTDYWVELRQALNRQVRKPLFMLSENEGVAEHFGAGFDMNYGWEYHHTIKQIAKGKASARILDTLFDTKAQRFGPRAYQMLFTQNHDENTWNGTERELFGEGADAFTALSFVLPGMPLIYSGQEASLDKRLSFFHKDEIDWKGRSRSEFFRKLNLLRENNKAVWAGEAGGMLRKIATSDDRRVYAFRREKGGDRVVGIFNLSGQPVTVTLNDNVPVGSFTDVMTGQRMDLANRQALTLQPWQYWILQ